MDNHKKYFNKYSELRNEIDGKAFELEALHSKHMLCKKGCDLCCMDYSIFPVEFYFVLNELKKNTIKIVPAENICFFAKPCL